MAKDIIIKSYEYKKFFDKLREEILVARQKAYQTVNKQLVELYLHIGKGIYEKIEISKWGEGHCREIIRRFEKRVFRYEGIFQGKSLEGEEVV